MHLFETTRLKARNFTKDDLKLLNDLHSDELLMKTTSGNVQTIEETKKELEQIISQQEKYQLSQWAFFTKEENNFVGRCGIIYRNFAEENDFNFELRYAIHRHFQGLGYGGEMAKASIEYAFQNPKIQNIIGSVRLDGNEASTKILQKLNFKYIQNKVFHSNKKECKIWQVSKEEWLKDK